MEIKKQPLWLSKLPNRLTWLRILCIPFVVCLLLYSRPAQDPPYFFAIIPQTPSTVDIIAAIIFALAALTDFLDGWIARKFKLETVLGKLLDPLADKLLIVSSLIILVEKHRLLGWVAVLIIVRDLGINAIRLSAIDENIHIPSNVVGKFKTTLLDIGIIGLIIHGPLLSIPFHLIGIISIFLALLASIVSAFQYLWFYAYELNKRKIKAIDKKSKIEEKSTLD